MGVLKVLKMGETGFIVVCLFVWLFIYLFAFFGGSMKGYLDVGDIGGQK